MRRTPKYTVLHKRWMETAQAVTLVDEVYEADDVVVNEIGTLMLYRYRDDEHGNGQLKMTHAFPPGVWMNLDIEGESPTPGSRLMV